MRHRSALTCGAATGWMARPQAPAVGTVLGLMDHFVDGSGREFVFGAGLNAFRMLVVRQGSRVFGYVNLCPHYSLPLNVRADEFLSRDGTRIMCRRHLAIFAIEDGQCIEGACVGSVLDKVPLQIDALGQVAIG